MKNLLLPEVYVVRSKYLTHWSYRVTWYIVVAGVIINSFMIFAWKKMNAREAEAQETAQMLTREEAELSKKKAEIEPVIAKYKEVSEWQSMKRIPVAPILEAVERTIDTECGLTSFDWELVGIEKGMKNGRITMNVFSSDIGGGTLAADGPFLVALKKALGFYGIVCGEFKISEPEPGDGGNRFDVTFDVSFGRKGAK